MNKLILTRRASQVFFLIFFIYILWSTTYPLKGAVPPDTFFKINPLIIFITSISQRVPLSGMLICALMIVLTFIFGRFFCGWICPLGTTIDMVGAIRRGNLSLRDAADKRLRRPKFFILGAIILLSLIGIQLAWVLDPMVIMARFVSLNLIPAFTLVLDRFFVFMIKASNFYGPLQDFYRTLKSSFLGVNIHYFSHSFVILATFVLVAGSALLIKRFWCRSVCPLGGLYSLTARFSLLRRSVVKCTECGVCRSRCRMGAIKDDTSYIKGECILCMDCLYDCKPHATKFVFPFFKKEAQKEIRQKSDERGISRRGFLLLLAASSALLTGFRARGQKGVNGHANSVIRPPAALKEDRFLDRCVRCGNCMKVCITNGLQPVLFQSGLSGLWTPQLVPEIGYCEYQCTLCGKTCPTGAIPRLTLPRKKVTRLGIAKIDRATCIPWSKGRGCIVCEEHCPIPNKAIKLKKESLRGEIISKPYVDISLCVGCGICQNKCPVRPDRAIKVHPVSAHRS
jgi:MauM/NapG family ferredoxin protein